MRERYELNGPAGCGTAPTGAAGSWDRLHAAEPDLAVGLIRRVERGADLLDRVEPGWAARIACDELAMESCDRCILGQLEGDFRAGFRKLLAPLPSTNLYSAALLGFTLMDREQDPGSANWPAPLLRFAALSDLWRGEVRKRLAI